MDSSSFSCGNEESMNVRSTSISRNTSNQHERQLSRFNRASSGRGQQMQPSISLIPSASPKHQQSNVQQPPQLPRDAELTLIEKQFLLACERGDLAKVRHILEQHSDDPSFDPNCTDPLSRTALRIAIENENSEMIVALLEHSIETGDALLHAISEENVEAVELLLDYLDKEDKFSAERQGVEITERSTFTPDLTPIILAAHRDNYEIIKLLLDRGASIPHPHDVRCDCRECLLSNMEDSLRLSRSRINAYRALSSPSLICLSARDPILYAFEMSWELRRLSNIENEFKSDYEELSQKCQKFAVDLLDQTRGSKELEIILNYDNSDRYPVKERAPGERMQLTRLKLAIQYRQKKFVAHPNCQQLLASIWYEGLPGFRRRHVVFKVLLILGIAFGFPILAMIYLIAPKSMIGKFVRQPFIKFLIHSASYCFFLFLLILASQRINYDELFGAKGVGDLGVYESEESKEERKERRGPPPTPVEWAIIIWVVGLIWVEVKQLWSMGLYEYTHNMWNILDFITNCLYIATIALRAIAYIGVRMELQTLDPHLRPEALMFPRRKWDAWDPTLISECVFATANIFSSLKLVHMFTVNPHLGPLQISLGRMVIDIVKFFVVYCLVLFAFACGLNQLFWYYATMRFNDCQKSTDPNITATSTKEQLEEWQKSCEPRFSSFGNLYLASESLLWATFGLVDLEKLQLSEKHFVSEWVGKAMFGGYCIIAIVVVLNMLIAMMANSFATIDVMLSTQLILCPPKPFLAWLLYNTVETLFWSIFGLIGLEHFELSNGHHITVWVGKTMFGTYGYISVVVLLNMLIAMMSNSYQYISNQADVEWKFARSKLWIEYFDESGTLPVPFNCIPSPKSVYYGLRWLCDRFCKCARRNHRVQQRSLRLQKILKAVSQREANYQFVMRNLVKRYVAFIQRTRQQAEGVSEDDVNEIKQDVNAFRYELLDILSKNGFKFDTGPAAAAGGRSKRRNAEAERRLMKGSHFYAGHSRMEAAPTVASDSAPAPYWTRQGQKLSFRHHRMQMKAAQLASQSSTQSAPVSALGVNQIPTSGSAQSLSQQRLAKWKRLGRKLPMAKRLMELATAGSSQTLRSASDTSMALSSRGDENEKEITDDQGAIDVNPKSAMKRPSVQHSRSMTLYTEKEGANEPLVPPSTASSSKSTIAAQQRVSFLWPPDDNDSLLDIEAQVDDTLL